MNRRKFMRLAAAGLGSALAPLAPGCAAEIGQQRPTTHLPTPDAPFTPTAKWYVMSIQDAYEADLERYRLKVGGVVDDGLSLSVPRMREEFEPALEMVTLACVGNAPNGRLMSSSHFRGVRMRDLIARVGVASRASGAFITGLDGFVAYQTMEDLARQESLLVYDMGPSPGELEPLPIENGFPCRLLTPGLYGTLQPKWIDAITFIDQGGYQEVVAGSIPYFEGKIQLASGFSVPRVGNIDAGPKTVLGFAFGDGRPIARVEVSVDGGRWQSAVIEYNEMGDELPSYLWALWSFDWLARAGSHELRCRATYDDGETQYEGMRFPYSGGSIASLSLQVRGSSALEEKG